MEKGILKISSFSVSCRWSERPFFSSSDRVTALTQAQRLDASSSLSLTNKHQLMHDRIGISLHKTQNSLSK
ncbi:hypothetical protein J6590_084629 [Homalodisca vitripennis]|nr:hypothetical protein J6590_084629 [Homalodisca vitripennis]